MAVGCEFRWSDEAIPEKNMSSRKFEKNAGLYIQQVGVISDGAMERYQRKIYYSLVLEDLQKISLGVTIYSR